MLLLDPDHPDEPPDMLPTSHLPLFLSQQSIGWDHLFYGHFSKDWKTQQHSYLHFVKKPRSKHQASNFLKELLSELWALVHSLWLHRNEHLHGPSDTPLHSIKRSYLISEISSLYDLLPSMLASNRAIFDYPLSERQKHSTMSLRNFLHFASPIIKRSINEAAIIGAQTKPLTAYFGPRFPIPSSLFDTIHPLVDHLEYGLEPD
jgi:hypothetical protein